ncbi:MAG: DUF6950 family protein [Burkholderiaceae bacterium]
MKQLDDFIAANAGEAFAWASKNCCHFAAAWVAFATGRNPMAGIEAITSERQAMRVSARLGGLHKACAQRLGSPAIPGAMAQRGDIVLLRGPGLGLIGICNGADAVALTHSGLGSVPMTEALAAWRLPR